MIQRRDVFLGSILSLAVFTGIGPGRAEAKDRDSLDGTWEGLLTPVQGQGFNEHASPPRRWRFVLSGASARVFLIVGSELGEVKPGQFQLRRQGGNALISSLDSGRDDDGNWTETEAFLILQKTPDLLQVLFSGAVSNNSLPSDSALRHFFTVSTGDFSRVS